jgi:DegV family protein with EDD domain
MASNAFSGRVKIIDSKSLSTGIALLAITAKKLVDAGEPVDRIVERVTNRVPFVNASFELKRLDFLHKGGRCSSLALLGANIFNIHPQIVVKNGKMVAGKKYRGSFSKVVDNYCRDTLEQFNNPDLDTAFVTYTTAPQEIVDLAKRYLQDAGFKNIYETRAGGTVTSHCGENTLGILYINDGGNY